ncbi:MAG: hypothetical protein QM751_13015 [Paludibacteraceae bacterium]
MRIKINTNLIQAIYNLINARITKIEKELKWINFQTTKKFNIDDVDIMIALKLKADAYSEELEKLKKLTELYENSIYQ